MHFILLHFLFTNQYSFFNYKSNSILLLVETLICQSFLQKILCQGHPLTRNPYLITCEYLSWWNFQQLIASILLPQHIPQSHMSYLSGLKTYAHLCNYFDYMLWKQECAKMPCQLLCTGKPYGTRNFISFCSQWL